MFFKDHKTDYGKNAMMRLDDIEARLNKQFKPQQSNSVVLSGRPNVSLDNRIILIGKVMLRQSKLSIIFKYKCDESVQLLINGLTAIIGEHDNGISFASVNIATGVENTILLCGSGHIESYQLFLTGDNIMADSASVFNFDYYNKVGLGVVVEGGNVNITLIIDDSIYQPFVLMPGTCADVLALKDEFFLAIVDMQRCLWLLNLDKNLNTKAISFLANGIDSVTLTHFDSGLAIAMLSNKSLHVGIIRENVLVSNDKFDIDRVKDVKWVKKAPHPMLTLCIDNNSTLWNMVSLKDKFTTALTLNTKVNFGY
ncbi:MAG: hypothetical protein LBU60_06250 [Clostridiales bacterium]|jgi:hypothetical protein|nr:hypothetical protein [Clostridiales bacterium]